MQARRQDSYLNQMDDELRFQTFLQDAAKLAIVLSIGIQQFVWSKGGKNESLVTIHNVIEFKVAAKLNFRLHACSFPEALASNWLFLSLIEVFNHVSHVSINSKTNQEFLKHTERWEYWDLHACLCLSFCLSASLLDDVEQLLGGNLLLSSKSPLSCHSWVSHCWDCLH